MDVNDQIIQTHEETKGQSPEIDLPTLLSSIRVRYKLLCSSLGIRPRLTTTSNKDGQVDLNPDDQLGSGSDGGARVRGEGIVEGIEGPMKGVDTRQLRF